MENIDLINYLVGGTLILCGFLINKYPELIAGYNTMSKEEKENFNIDGYKSMLKKTSIITGIFIIVFTFISSLLSWTTGKIYVAILSALLMFFYLVYKSRDFYKITDKKTQRKHSGKLIFLIVLVIGVVCFLFYASREPKISISNEKIEISGLYGFDIQVKNVDSVLITDRLPKISLRTNGFDLGNIKKGYFETKNQGTCKLFLQTRDTPYLKIKYSDNKLMYLNFKDKNKTMALYKELVSIKANNKE